MLLTVACTSTAPAPLSEELCAPDPLRELAEPMPERARRRAEKAVAAAAIGDLEEARSLWREAAAAGGELPARLGLAQLALLAGDAKGAARDAEELVQLRPRWGAARITLACAEERLGRTSEAIEQWQRAAALTGRSDLARRAEELGEVAARELAAAAREAERGDDLERAERLAAELLALRPGEAAAHVLAGRLKLRRDDPAAARSEFRRALEIAPGDTEALEGLAHAEAQLGNHSAAIEHYEALVAGDPGRDDLRQALARARERWTLANTPPAQRAALASTALTRRELATLLWWKVPEVRVSRGSIGKIAVDIHDLPERDQIIRALALGLFDVDESTHRFSPNRVVSRGELARTLDRLVALFRRGGGGAKCLDGSSAAQPRDVPSAELRAIVARLVACNILSEREDGMFQPGASATGVQAAGALEALSEIF